MSTPILETERLILREWRESDRQAFAEMCADPDVMKHFPATLNREQSDARVAKIQGQFADNGYGLWAVELRDVAPFIGFIGLNVPTFDAHFTPCVEVGWRLAKAYWRQGLATEGARASLRFGFEDVGLKEIVSMTVPANKPSWGVMEKLGMHRDPSEDFEHPLLPVDHHLRKHVLYRMSQAEYLESKALSDG